MAVSKISKPGVEKTSRIDYAKIDANPQSGTYMQIQVKSSLGEYILVVYSQGITIYDNDSHTELHRIAWTT